MVTRLMDNGDDAKLYFLDFIRTSTFLTATFSGQNTSHGVYRHMIGWIQSFLGNNLFQVQIGDVIFKVAAITNRISQSSAITQHYF